MASLNAPGVALVTARLLVNAGAVVAQSSAGPERRIALTFDELGGTAAERGAYREILRSRSGTQVLSEEGKYVMLGRRSSDGAWRFAWSIYNRDGPVRAMH